MVVLLRMENKLNSLVQVSTIETTHAQVSTIESSSEVEQTEKFETPEENDQNETNVISVVFRFLTSTDFDDSFFENNDSNCNKTKTTPQKFGLWEEYALYIICTTAGFSLILATTCLFGFSLWYKKQKQTDVEQKTTNDEEAGELKTTNDKKDDQNELEG